MANAFDAANAPEGEPKEIVVGDFIQWKRSDLIADYPIADYSAEYVARVTAGGSDEIKLLMVETATHYLATATSAESAAFAVGDYHWQLEITKTSTGDRIVVDRGMFTAIPDLDNNQADPRSFAAIMVDKIQTILKGKADSDVASYSVAGRSLTKLTFQELMDAESYYQGIVTKEKAVLNAKQGRSTGTTVKVRF